MARAALILLSTPTAFPLTISFYMEQREWSGGIILQRGNICQKLRFMPHGNIHYLNNQYILFHMWTRVVVTSCDLLVNGLQPTTPRVNPAVSKAVFIADVIFETALFFSCDNAELSERSLFRRLVPSNAFQLQQRDWSWNAICCFKCLHVTNTVHNWPV